MESFEKEFDEILLKIGLNVSYYRRLNKLTQEELSEMVGVTRTVIGHIEAPDMHYGMKLKTLYRISKALGIPIGKLFDFRE